MAPAAAGRLLTGDHGRRGSDKARGCPPTNKPTPDVGWVPRRRAQNCTSLAAFAPAAVVPAAVGILSAAPGQLIALAPLSATIVLALNQSAIHVGAAVGSATGALTLIYAAPAALGVAAASLTLLALGLLIAEQRCGKSKMPTHREALQRAADGHA